MIIPLLVGIVVGFLMGIPIGPINVWVMKTKITHGRGAASSIGFAGAIMDGITVFFILSGLRFFNIPEYFVKQSPSDIMPRLPGANSVIVGPSRSGKSTTMVEQKAKPKVNCQIAATH